MEKLIEEMSKVFYGDMGIRKIYKGDNLLYERYSSYIYLQLINEDGEE